MAVLRDRYKERSTTCSDHVALEIKIRDLQSKFARTSAQLVIATAREGHCADDPSSSRSLGSRQVEGERAQNAPAQLDRRGLPSGAA